ncbi:MAG: hypothetical protein NC293_12520 [Roseburia sp.]|nr:hypothetical protein [Roseburia sp.]
MGFLPIPGEMYLNDAPDKTHYSILRSGNLASQADGLTNTDEDGKHIAFLYGTDVVSGDTIQTANGKSYTVKFTDTDDYNGKPAIIKAYY